ncbi:MAG: hypothetical protein CSA95_02075 [Bacteroidetes bacterium]|nr:MAG: hypothetical protein CSA95_02075 [Bacteroidota bacterium]
MEGFAASSDTQSQRDAVARYIINQPEHYRKKGFMEEYKTLLEQFNVSHREPFLFDAAELRCRPYGALGGGGRDIAVTRVSLLRSLLAVSL